MNAVVLLDGESVAICNFTDDALILARHYESQSRHRGKVKVLWSGTFSAKPEQIYPPKISVHKCGDGSLESKLEMGGIDE